jgi:hypothetical protein|tara:strand:+ start:126 stop:890 length:765 start_codon:yes stop_codon:yes gene_type:complete
MEYEGCIVVYSHTDFSDLLQIQTDKLKGINLRKILFINKNENHYKDYDQVCFYDDYLPYASKLKRCLDQVEEDKLLFIHDNDILIDMDLEFINRLSTLMDEEGINKIDLKDSPYDKHPSIASISGIDVLCQSDVNQYIYNVNPSLWRKEYFYRIVSNFPNASYRDIESFPVQHFCREFNFAVLKSLNPLKCGYFECNSFFKFLHITHSRVLLRLNDECVNSQGQSYIDLKEDYKKIVQDYNLRDSNMWDNLSNG